MSIIFIVNGGHEHPKSRATDCFWSDRPFWKLHDNDDSDDDDDENGDAGDDDDVR